MIFFYSLIRQSIKIIESRVIQLLHDTNIQKHSVKYIPSSFMKSFDETQYLKINLLDYILR